MCDMDFVLHMWRSVEELGAQEEGHHTITFNLHGEHNGRVTLAESFKKILLRLFAWHTGGVSSTNRL